MKKNNVSIVEIGPIVGTCYDEVEDVWTGYDQDTNKIDVICAIQEDNPQKQMFDNLKSKIGVNIARKYGTQFVEQFCNISIINYL